MFSGPPLPLPPDFLLSHLLAYVRPRATLGAWLRGPIRRLYLYQAQRTGGGRVIVSPDLGLLLRHCARVAVREEERMVVLDAETVIQWRALQVATATPYLPGAERLGTLFPGLRSNEQGFLVPVRARSPEEVLARCVAEGVRVTGSRIVYHGR